MKDIEGYVSKEVKEDFLKKIQNMEDYFIENKVGTTTKDGRYTYEYLLMLNKTYELLSNRKTLKDEEVNDLTIGDIS